MGNPNEMTQMDYINMKLAEITATQLAFNEAASKNLKLLTENVQYLAKEVAELKKGSKVTVG